MKNDQPSVNPYDLNSVGKNLHRNGVRKITSLRSDEPYNAGGATAVNQNYNKNVRKKN